MKFAHETPAQRAVFAPGEAVRTVVDEVARLGSGRVLIVGGPSARALTTELSAHLTGARVHDEVVEHVPVEAAERARAVAHEHAADALVCVGGGSATGLAKAVALTTKLPIVAVPTTYAGSEATNVWGLTRDGVKTTGVDAAVLPATVVYDASLLLTLPGALAVASGLNALAHCVDAMWGPRADPIDRAMAQEAARALSAGLPEVGAHPDRLAGHEQMLYGAYLAAVVFASAGSGLHHKICHVLGGRFDLPHAQTHAVVLPHVLALNAPHAPEAERRVAAALDAPTATEGLAALYARLDAPTSLKELGMPESGIAEAVEPVLAAVPEGNPAPVTRDRLSALLRAAWEGDIPR
ncbi:maleylacetate reductase [Streptomyces sp. NBC_01016]|uniref:maleylacetate reductase n=1 Tax=Streptomyces sp. NBC_01016 TaxID=2903720 RepID=UPI00225427AD|nr:maleylacetate reductase [Streptomyces sp. NBC_01016]MCX4834817.1 maleylacetate reductase [Streptomyces sp. NBC_01016]